jgi:hypothetical protein
MVPEAVKVKPGDCVRLLSCLQDSLQAHRAEGHRDSSGIH